MDNTYYLCGRKKLFTGMIKGKGQIRVVAGHANIGEMTEATSKLPDGDYLFVICDEKKNRNLPYISYLFSVVLKYLSDALPDHPSTISLYKFFEARFAPVHTSRIEGSIIEYCDLKSERASDVNDVIERIVEYASDKWGIEVPRQEDLKDPEMRELHSQAYLNQEVEWSNFISSRKKSKENERRNEEKRV